MTLYRESSQCQNRTAYSPSRCVPSEKERKLMVTRSAYHWMTMIDYMEYKSLLQQIFMRKFYLVSLYIPTVKVTGVSLLVTKNLEWCI